MQPPAFGILPGVLVDLGGACWAFLFSLFVFLPEFGDGLIILYLIISMELSGIAYDLDCTSKL